MMFHKIKNLAKLAIKPITSEIVRRAIARGLVDIRLKSSNDYSYCINIPYATYAPWLDDPIFTSAYESIKENTLVDKYRCHELWQIAKHAARLGGEILEVGVWRGGTGCLIAHCSALFGATSQKVYLCDTFTGIVKAGEFDTQYHGGEHADTSIKIVRELADRLNLNNIEILQGIFPDEIGSIIENSQFSFCHIDVDVYNSACDTLNWIWPRLQLGGVIIFDDYGFSTCDGVTRLVNEYSHRPDVVAIHNLNGHAVFIKIADGVST